MNRNKRNFSFFFAGHFAIDTIIRFGKENAPTLGGSVTYSTLALSTYTEDADIYVISNIGKFNFDKSLLNLFKSTKINLEGIKWSETNNTNFVLDYFDHGRTLTLKSKSPNLEFKDIPKELLKIQPDVVVLVPLCNEITYDYIKKILKKYPKAYIGIDLQGFIRKIDSNGKVLYVPDANIVQKMDKIADLIGEKLILKGSEEEMKLYSDKKDLNTVMNYFSNSKFKGISIMTLGGCGSMLVQNGQNMLKIPAFKPRCVIDETGAGDVYMSIFLYEYLKSDRSWKAIENAAYLASAAASFIVEKKGPDGFETKEEVLKRLNSKEYLDKSIN